MSSAGVATPSKEELKRMATEVIDARADELVTPVQDYPGKPGAGFPGDEDGAAGGGQVRRNGNAGPRRPGPDRVCAPTWWAAAPARHWR